MWIKSQTNVLINLNHIESIYLEGASIICVTQKPFKEAPNKRVIAIFPEKDDAEIMLGIISGALADGTENILYVPSAEAIKTYREGIEAQIRE